MGACAGKAEETARELARLAQGDLTEIPRDALWKATLSLMADACAEIEDRATAPLLYDALLPYTHTNTAVAAILPYGSMARVVGRLATLLGRWDEAQGHFETALDANARMGFTAWIAWTQLNYGDMLLRRDRSGDVEPAHELLTSGLAFAREAGMRKVWADTERLLGSSL